MTYTVAILEIDAGSYHDIRSRIERLNTYGHMFMPDGSIDMTHIAVRPAVPITNPFEALREFIDKSDFDNLELIKTIADFDTQLADYSRQFEERRQEFTDNSLDFKPQLDDEFFEKAERHNGDDA